MSRERLSKSTPRKPSVRAAPAPSTRLRPASAGGEPSPARRMERAARLGHDLVRLAAAGAGAMPVREARRSRATLPAPDPVVEAVWEASGGPARLARELRRRTLTPAPPGLVQRGDPPSGEDWEQVNKVVAILRTKDWVKSAFPVAQGSQVVLKDVDSEGICRTIVYEWLRQVRARRRTEFLEKFERGDVEDLLELDNEFVRQSVIFAARNAPEAPEPRKVDAAREFLLQYSSVGGRPTEPIVPNTNKSSQTLVDAITENGFYNVVVHWGEDKGHALGVVKSGEEYYFLDPNHYEVHGTAAVLTLLKGVLDSIYGPERKENPTYGLLFAPGEIEGTRCFLTTAAVRARGLPDDCEELVALRRFRDGYLRRRPGGGEAVRHYYALAPRVLAALAGRNDEEEVLEGIFAVASRCVALIREERHEEAFALYRRMVGVLEAGLGLAAGDLPRPVTPGAGR